MYNNKYDKNFEGRLRFNLIPRNNKAPIFRLRLYLNLVPEDGLEPSLPKETDFESVVYTNFTTRAYGGYYTYTMQRGKPLSFRYSTNLFGCYVFTLFPLLMTIIPPPPYTFCSNIKHSLSYRLLLHSAHMDTVRKNRMFYVKISTFRADFREKIWFWHNLRAVTWYLMNK